MEEHAMRGGRSIISGAFAACLLAVAALLGGPAAAGAPTLRIGVIEGGTVSWELDVIKRRGLDAAEGLTIEVMPMAGKQATDVALLGGAVDAVVTDWLWVARQRAAGRDFVFVPYSKSVGGLMVAADSPVRSLADLKGRKIGVAGGPVDKSWLLMRALAKQRHGFDLATDAEAVFGAAPLVHQQALSGGVDGALNFWNWLAKLEARGFRTVATVAEASEALGLDPETPLLGYVIRGEALAANPGAADALLRASRAAKRLLAADDAEWAALRPMMNAADDAEFAALAAGFRAGIPAEAPVDEAAAAKLWRFLGEIGGPELIGDVTELPPGVFHGPGG
jgi:NitT/TauT family transport system substrate-binding protein